MQLLCCFFGVLIVLGSEFALSEPGLTWPTPPQSPICDDPPEIRGAYVALLLQTPAIEEGLVVAKATAIYACFEGLLQGSGMVFCRNGTWTSEAALPSCPEYSGSQTNNENGPSFAHFIARRRPTKLPSSSFPELSTTSSTTRNAMNSVVTQAETVQIEFATIRPAENVNELIVSNRGPQCRYGLALPHTLCLDDSSNLISIETSPTEEILALHNLWRRNVSPPAIQPIADLKWDMDLAATAERLAAQCKGDHDLAALRSLPDRGVNGSAWQWVGQNICKSERGDMTWSECIFGWAAERENWQYGVGKRIANGTNIGHYTQMIWADTLYVGCGKSRCDGDYEGDYILVCNYGPAGNIGRNGVSAFARPYESQ